MHSLVSSNQLIDNNKNQIRDGKDDPGYEINGPGFPALPRLVLPQNHVGGNRLQNGQNYQEEGEEQQMVVRLQ